MTMHGIDISNWQTGLKISKIDIDFCICKATEGLNFVDAYCDGFIKDCKSKGIPYGFYHFARENDAAKEAEFFYKNCKGYIGKGIPVLDYETSNKSNRTWCEKFLKRFHELSGIWPLLYISASRCGEYENSWIPDKCGLWVAGYPYEMDSFDRAGKMPYSVYPWKAAAIWQFSSDVKLDGYSGRLDADIAYMDAKAWAKYAGNAKSGDASSASSASSASNSVDYDALVKAVLAGKYGSGNTRKKKLGTNYTEVQKRIDEYYDIADEVIVGKWGNGWNRQQALTGAGYPYDIIQSIVNAKLG